MSESNSNSNFGCLSIIAIIVVIGLIGNYFKEANKSSSGTSTYTESNTTGTSSQETHTCYECGREFTGLGWYHILGDCNMSQDPKGSFQNAFCSESCCEKSELRRRMLNPQ